MKRILSGIQPTASLHLGNYLGALKNWVTMQHTGECFFFIVDLHAITVPQDPVKLLENIRQAAAVYIAAGLDPDKNVIFPQSQIPHHAELMWILACNTPLGWLNRMTQFKDKAKKGMENAGLGLYAYPVLMAADILLYQAHEVPVGDDQKQHLELTRDIAGAFNRQYQQPLFVVPEPKIRGAGTRIMSLKDGTVKMSKSDPAAGSRIHLMDTPDEIIQKLRKAKTDSGVFPLNEKESQGRPEVINLIQIYKALTHLEDDSIYQQFGGKKFSGFKIDLATVIIESLSPMQVKYHQLMNEKGYLDAVLQKGIHKARNAAEKTMNQVRSAIGLYHSN